MGFGSAPFGTTLSGADAPVDATAEMRVLPLYQARYDLRIRGVPRAATGLLETAHWVDQAVALALGVKNGALPSQPSLGNTLLEIKRAAGPTLQAEVENRVKVALKALVDRSDIGVLSVTMKNPVRGQVLVFVSYVNLRIAPDAIRDLAFIY